MDLSTKYMKLSLEHPVVASASPLSMDLDGIRRLEDGGAAAIVLFSLFEEQLRQEAAAIDYLTGVGGESFGESLSYFPAVDDYAVGPDRYLDLIGRAVEAVDVPVIGSLNCVTAEGWSDFATAMVEAGASAIELNVFHLAGDPELDGRAVEALYLDALRAVRAAVEVPVALKLSPYFSAFAHMARQLADNGADALVLFNRFYQPDFDLEALDVSSRLALSQPEEIRLPLRWIAMLKGRVDVSLGATTGVESADEVIKYLLAGADVVMSTSALLRKGPGHIRVMVDGLSEWLERRGLESVEAMKGMLSQARVADPSAFARANYIEMLESWKRPQALVEM